MLKVVHVVLDLHEGGLERVVTDLVLNAAAAGHVAHVVCLRRAGQLAAELTPGLYSVVPPQRRLSMVAPLGLARFLRRLEPDVVHLHSGVWFKAAYASRLAGVGPVLVTDHGRPFPDPGVHRGFDAFGARLSDHVVAVSAPLGEYLVSRLHVSRTKLSVIPNGIRLPDQPSGEAVAAARLELALPPNIFLLGAVGRLDPIKAYDRLIMAFTQLLPEATAMGRPLALVMVGDGPERPRLELLAHELGVADSVRFVGWRTDVTHLLGAMDLFVLPSDSEGTSISLLEAMALGKPVIATAVGGTPDVIGPNGAGLSIPPGDLLGLVDGIRELILNDSQRDRMGVRARARVKEQYSFDAMAEAYSNLYRALRAALVG